MVFHYFTKDSSESSDADRIVLRNGEVMLVADRGGHPAVGANLPREFITEVRRRDFSSWAEERSRGSFMPSQAPHLRYDEGE